jgi:hypothetical protein
VDEVIAFNQPPWSIGSENEDDEESLIEYQSDMSGNDLRLLDDNDGSDYDYGGSRVSFRLREILFCDDQIAIFKARHGVLRFAFAVCR